MSYSKLKKINKSAALVIIVILKLKFIFQLDSVERSTKLSHKIDNYVILNSNTKREIGKDVLMVLSRDNQFSTLLSFSHSNKIKRTTIFCRCSVTYRM